FRHDPGDPSSLSHDAVGAVFEDSAGRLWVGTGDFEEAQPGGGLNLLDRATGTFTRYVHDPDDPTSLSGDVVTAIREDGSGALWVATAGAGLNRLDPATGAFSRYRHDDDDRGSLVHDWVFDLEVDTEAGLWVATADGLDLLPPGRERFLHYQRDPESSRSLASNAVSSIYLDPDGALWVGTWSGALHRMDPGTGVFQRYENDPDDPKSLVANGGIFDIVRDRSEILWIATRRGGLAKLDEFAYKFPHLGHDPADENSLSGDHVTGFAEDSAGNIWIGTADAGLNRYNPVSETVTRFRHDWTDPRSLGSDEVNALLVHSSGSLWVGTYGGLDRWSPGADAFTHFRGSGGEDGLSSSWVLSLAEAADGGIWIGQLEGGLSRLDPGTGRFTHYRHDPDDPDSLAHDTVRVIRQDGRGALWIGTDAGLDRLDPGADRFVHHVDPELGLDVVTALHEDRDGRLWIGTLHGGLHRLDREAGITRPFTRREGLPHDSVHSILEDGEGNLWLGTGFGISRFDPARGVFRNYDPTDGLAAHRFDGGGLRTSRGELLFGSPQGANAFFPADIRDNPYPPQVVLTSLRLFDQPALPGAEGSPLERHLSATREISLSHRDWMVAFEFTALHFGNPARNRFAYRLLPLEREWRQAGQRRQARYTNLAPGAYEFQVKAANEDGVWNETGASVRLTVRAPWWRSRWAWALWVGLGLLALVTVDRLQRRRVVGRERARAREEQSRLRTEAAELQAKAAEAQARALHVENERKTQELEAARQLQLSLLPADLPDHPELEIATYMKTATEVGGDFYDFDLAGEGTLTVAIGDATGHGTRAGMMVTATKVLFKLLAGQRDAVALLRESTLAVRRLELQNLFMALSIARLHPGGELEIAGAGMPPALLVRAGGGVEELISHGAPLGSFPDYPYEARHARLAPGDTLVLMSDGLPERLGPAGEVLGYPKVAEALAGAAPGGAGPQALIDRLAALADAWAEGRPPDDDLTLVVLRRRA
ncbi:MAG: two-component regulator propeller domain-containing protein, partial [Thermoanaerobaculia bacterium]|nr:two-component regulator propeller domain-containing protein [Thermoanaerobaculia bacterium]